MTQQSKIIIRIAEGNPGALTVCVRLLAFPEAAEYFQHLDACGRRGSALWLFFNDVHNRDIRAVIRALNVEIAYQEKHGGDPADLTTRDGLLIRCGQFINLPEADYVARKHGFQHAEQLVHHLQKTKEPA